MASRASRARGSVLPVVALVVIDVVVVLMLLGSTGAVDHATQGLDDSTRWSCAEHALADRSERRVGEMGEESRYVGPNTIEFEVSHDHRDPLIIRCTFRAGGDEVGDPLEVVEAEVLP